jgi:CelD/BcsL family acetyltransferase involved in cellulose biosynthesis
LSDGFEAYLAARKKAGSKRITQLQRKSRKLEREVGPVRLEMHVPDRDVLDGVIRWKSEQCRRTQVYDFFSDEPAVSLVRDIANTKVDGFEGVVSVLYAGDSVAAAHMGMRSGHVLHWWFPTYEHALSKYSPGGVLLLKLAEQASAAGVTLLDLGKGEDPYKDSFRTGAVPLIEGAVDVPSAPALIRRSRIGAERWLRRSPAMEPVRRAVRAVRGGAARRGG